MARPRRIEGDHAATDADKAVDQGIGAAQPRSLVAVRSRH
jgi:hypothetical protein